RKIGEVAAGITARMEHLDEGVEALGERDRQRQRVRRPAAEQRDQDLLDGHCRFPLRSLRAPLREWAGRWNERADGAGCSAVVDVRAKLRFFGAVVQWSLARSPSGSV